MENMFGLDLRWREASFELFSHEVHIEHFSHEHPLKLTLPNSELEWMPPLLAYRPSSSFCNACCQSCQDTDHYECRSCNYRLHKSCSELPQKLLNPYHQHALSAEVHQGEGIYVRCNACYRQIEGPDFFYYCQYCNLTLDVGCATLELTRDNFRYFGHFHPLVESTSAGTMSSYRCAVCGSLSTKSSLYRCNHCRFSVHQHCSELMLPQQIHHPFHPCLLTLTPMTKFLAATLLHYHCKNCNYKMNIKSALKLYRKKSKGKKKFYHFSHKHKLALRKQNNKDDQVNCSACRKPCSGPTYGCITCQFFLHQSCVDLPLEIQHFFHPCPLTLRIQQNSFNCGACDTAIRGFYFYCQWCDFSLDIECALLPTTKSQSQDRLCHFIHGHPLTLTEIKDGDSIYCSVCKRCCAGQAFVCRRCDFILDKSCSELRQEIQHPLHPHHPLVFQLNPTKPNSVCSVCCKNISGFAYHCQQCDFDMHVECTLLMPTVSYKGHNHLLLFLEDIDIEVECDRCRTPCSSSVFRCLECKFYLHLMCGPLPCKIIRERHDHPFVLTDSPLEDESDQFYCDVCEKERDPRLSVYYCQECQFPAEIKCLMSEQVVLTLKGHYGDVELRTTSGQITGKVISKSSEVSALESKEEQNNDRGIEGTEIKPVLTWDDVLISFNEDEKIELEGVLAPFRQVISETGETSNHRSKESEVFLFSFSDLLITFSADENLEMDSVLAAQGKGKILGSEKSSNDHSEDSDKNLKVSLFSDRAYKHFMQKLDSTTDYSSLTLWEGNEEVVDIRDNLVPQTIAPILQELCTKYGDISANCRLSPRVKSYFIVMLCGTMHSMRNTRIIDITENQNLLLNWWNNLKALKSAGFNVQFAFDHLEKLMRAYFGLLLKNAELELNKKMKDLSQIIEKSTRELEELEEKCDYIALARASKSSIINDCLAKASTEKWRTAGAGLL